LIYSRKGETTVELEQRVKTLEYEMKIMKNEVQRTLLDIQEQVLVYYYPALRAAEAKPSEGTIQAIEALRSRPTGQPAAPGAPPPAVPAEPPPPAPAAKAPSAAPAVAAASVAAAAPAVPVLTKVSLEEIRAAQEELATESPQLNTVTANKLVEWAKKSDAGSTAGVDGNAQATAERGGIKLLEWLMSSATKVNGERDEKRVNEVLEQLTKLNSLVDRASNMEEALRLIEEAKLG
jgi:hypothetical protein